MLPQVMWGNYPKFAMFPVWGGVRRWSCAQHFDPSLTPQSGTHMGPAAIVPYQGLGILVPTVHGKAGLGSALVPADRPRHKPHRRLARYLRYFGTAIPSLALPPAPGGRMGDLHCPAVPTTLAAAATLFHEVLPVGVQTRKGKGGTTSP